MESNIKQQKNNRAQQPKTKAIELAKQHEQNYRKQYEEIENNREAIENNRKTTETQQKAIDKTIECNRKQQKTISKQ